VVNAKDLDVDATIRACDNRESASESIDQLIIAKGQPVIGAVPEQQRL